MIVLIGFMGAGKSTVGRLLAARLGLPFVDTDAMIEARAGAPVAEIFRTGGEPAFRELEREIVASVLTQGDAVVALGGGAVEDPTTCSALQWTDVVHLDVSFGEALRRVGGSDRPMLSLRDPKELYDRRVATYRRLAHSSVATDKRSPGEIADELATQLDGVRAAASEATRIRVPLAATPYDVVVGEGLLERIVEVAPVLGGAAKALVVTHPVITEHAERVASGLRAAGVAVAVAPIAEGERSKSLATLADLYAACAREALHRGDVVMAVGGGVVCDIAGFVAATYNRGMRLVNVPTTLLAQVDAAVGGKTGINLPEGKNLVGSFHQPAAVVCDVATLTSLPEGELRSGLAEVLKYGFIADPELLNIVRDGSRDLFVRKASALSAVVARCVRIKGDIVARDERDELDVRAHLNYGHTFAHAIEQSAGYADVRHGDAVALGMMAAAYLARELDRIEEKVVTIHRSSLEAVGLPTSAALDLRALEPAWERDKKHDGGVRFVLLAELGRAEAGVTASRDAVAAALERLAAP